MSPVDNSRSLERPDRQTLAAEELPKAETEAINHAKPLVEAAQCDYELTAEGSAESQTRLRLFPHNVMRGLDPRIHIGPVRRRDVDGRNKCGHDDTGGASPVTHRTMVRCTAGWGP